MLQEFTCLPEFIRSKQEIGYLQNGRPLYNGGTTEVVTFELKCGTQYTDITLFYPKLAIG